MFDSVGERRHGKDIEHFLINNSIECNYLYNTVRLQSSTSNMCGYYCIYYCIFRSMGYSMREIIDMFSVDLIKNDEIVKDFYDDYQLV